MALGSTVFKVELQVSDLDRGYYRTHALTVAQHPSETGIRMMVRILAFALNATDQLVFTRGLSTDEVPDLWEKTLSGEISHWIEVGQPSFKRIKKACNQSQRVSVYTYSGHSAEIWWRQNQKDCSSQQKLRVINLPAELMSELENCIKRSMSLQCTIQDGIIWFGDTQNNFEISPLVWQDRLQ